MHPARARPTEASHPCGVSAAPHPDGEVHDGKPVDDDQCRQDPQHGEDEAFERLLLDGSRDVGGPEGADLGLVYSAHADCVVSHPVVLVVAVGSGNTAVTELDSGILDLALLYQGGELADSELASGVVGERVPQHKHEEGQQ